MSALYVITVVAGCTLPFLAENNKKDRIISGVFMLGDLVLIIMMVYSDIACIKYLGKPENVFIAGCLMVLSIAANGIRSLTASTKHTEAPKTHHQRIIDQKNHKAAS